jgi:hypothetical protein
MVKQKYDAGYMVHCEFVVFGQDFIEKRFKSVKEFGSRVDEIPQDIDGMGGQYDGIEKP